VQPDGPRTLARTSALAAASYLGHNVCRCDRAAAQLPAWASRWRDDGVSALLRCDCGGASWLSAAARESAPAEAASRRPHDAGLMSVQAVAMLDSSRRYPSQQPRKRGRANASFL
jgi:hypothetical protein